MRATLERLRSWRALQMEDLKAAIGAVDAGEFATDAEVRAVFACHAKIAPARNAARKAPANAKAAARGA
jgi:hypothetical protein